MFGSMIRKQTTGSGFHSVGLCREPVGWFFLPWADDGCRKIVIGQESREFSIGEILDDRNGYFEQINNLKERASKKLEDTNSTDHDIFISNALIDGLNLLKAK